MASKRYAAVDKKVCVACGACEAVCPLGAIQVYRGCYAKVREDKCVGCGRCEKVCPANSIQIESRESYEDKEKAVV